MFFGIQLSHTAVSVSTWKHHSNSSLKDTARYDDIIMGFYDKAFDNGLQAKAAGSKPILFPANQNLGRSGLYHS